MGVCCIAQCAPGANFKPVLDMLEKVLHYHKAAEAAAAGKSDKAAANQQKPGSQRPSQQNKVGRTASLLHVTEVPAGIRAAGCPGAQQAPPCCNNVKLHACYVVYIQLSAGLELRFTSHWQIADKCA